MIPPHTAHIAVSLIVAASIILMLIRPRHISEVWWIGGGVVLLIALRLIPVGLAGHAVGKGTDVYLFLTGMMLMSELARQHGVFDWMASLAIRGARGSAARLFVLVYGIGTLVTIFMSNDATAVVLTPAILTAVRKAKVQPLPCLFVCAMVANAASFVLPISNPANLVVFGQAMPSLTQWLSSFALPSVLSVAATFCVLRLYFRTELRGPLQAGTERCHLPRSGQLVLAGLALMVAVLLTASALKQNLGLPTCIAALTLGLLISGLSSRNPLALVRGISWTTLLLVAGLFVMVRATESQGVLGITRHWLAAASSLGQTPGALAVGAVVAIANNLINNLPMGLLAGATLQTTHTHGLLANTVLIAVDLGPNLSVTGSLASLLWLLALRHNHGDDNPQEEISVTFWQFFKVGAVAMPVALAAALAVEVMLHASGTHF